MAAVLEQVREAPAPMTVSLAITPDMLNLLRSEEGALSVAQGYEIDCAEMAQQANLELRRVKAAIPEIKRLRDGFLAPAKTIIANAEALFNPALKALEQSEAVLKGRLLAFQQAEQRRADEERRAAEAAARRARQEAEAKAAAERARAEALAAEERRKAAEAEERRKAAEAEAERARADGDAKAAAEAARRAASAAAAVAKAEERATNVVSNAEATATELALTAAATNIAPVAAPTAISGFSQRKNWIAELSDSIGTENAAKLEIVKSIAAGRTELLALLSLDWSAAKKMAKALESNFNVPGLVARNAPIAHSRG
ncbi:MAG TPA: hypothetical protein VN667_14565 [Burkholderiales bacterium]|nr:hypothetical protein [Burkholderiales bacterium]